MPYPMIPPNVLRIRSSISANLPIKYCINSIQKEKATMQRIVFGKNLTSLNATGVINPIGTNIKIFVINCVI